VAGETPTGEAVSPPLPGTVADVPMVVPGRLRQDGGSDSIPRQTAPGDSQKPLRGLQIVPATHCA
jgi:hypothetical protein